MLTALRAALWGKASCHLCGEQADIHPAVLWILGALHGVVVLYFPFLAYIKQSWWPIGWLVLAWIGLEMLAMLFAPLVPAKKKLKE